MSFKTYLESQYTPEACLTAQRLAECGIADSEIIKDPAELMAFMVKNPGLIPSVSTVKAGEIGRRRDAMFEMFQGFWRACINATG